jgi:hypothetical protein
MDKRDFKLSRDLIAQNQNKLFLLCPLKVSRSRDKIVEPQILPKNEQTNFSILNSDRKTNLLVSFLFMCLNYLLL